MSPPPCSVLRVRVRMCVFFLLPFSFCASKHMTWSLPFSNFCPLRSLTFFFDAWITGKENKRTWIVCAKRCCVTFTSIFMHKMGLSLIVSLNGNVGTQCTTNDHDSTQTNRHADHKHMPFSHTHSLCIQWQILLPLVHAGVASFVPLCPSPRHLSHPHPPLSYLPYIPPTSYIYLH